MRRAPTRSRGIPSKTVRIGAGEFQSLVELRRSLAEDHRARRSRHLHLLAEVLETRPERLENADLKRVLHAGDGRLEFGLPKILVEETQDIVRPTPCDIRLELEPGRRT